MRSYSLAKQTDGINLMRSKGGASDKSLFDLVNAWVTPKGVIAARPGATMYDGIPNGVGFTTVGLTADVTTEYAVFIHAPFSYLDSKVSIRVLRHPTNNTSAKISKIHAAFPFLGKLYVVAEFDDGVIQHYYLDDPASWTANTVYGYGQRVRANAVGFGAKNGFYYKATNVDTTIAWQASTTKVVGNYVQPTVSNGFKYQATAVSGTAPILTSNTEPTWPTTDGATVVERRYAGEGAADPGASTPPTPKGPSRKPTTYGPFPPKSNANRTF